MSRWPGKWFAIAAGCLLVSCVRLDASHCANLQGDATCAERDEARPYCSECTATNDGCVAEPVATECVPALGSSSSSQSDGSATIADGGDDPSIASDPSADDGASSAPTTADITATSASTNVSDDDDSVGDGDAGSTSNDESTTTATDDDGPEDDDDTTPATMTDTPGESSDGGPYCGNGIREGDEECDGDDLDGMTCLEHPEYASGTMGCDQYCMFNGTQCEECLNLIGGCTLDAECCMMQHCNLGLCIL
jgi:hypothetical protein